MAIKYEPNVYCEYDYEQYYLNDQSNSFQQLCDETLNAILVRCEINKPIAKTVKFPNPLKLLTTKRKYVRKTFPVTPKSIIFNKSIMAKHPNIELDTTSVFKSMIHMIEVLQTEDDCRKHLEWLRWNGEPICPHCGSQRKDHYRIKTRGLDKGRYKCKDCRLPFSVTVGTMFDSSQISLKKWFMAIYIFSSHKKGISSIQLSKDLGVTQKTAWYMLSRLRNTFSNKVTFQFDDITQVDETFVGGLNLNRTKSKKVAKTQGRSIKTKVPVFGMLCQGMVYTEVIRNTKGSTLRNIIHDKVKFGATVVSDGWIGYKGLNRNYEHIIIDHNKGVFKKQGYHTNGIEGFWSQLKRGIIGVYHSTSRKHLHKYCDEFTYRYNTRHMSDGERFNLSLINADERLSYKDLIAA